MILKTKIKKVLSINDSSSNVSLYELNYTVYEDIDKVYNSLKYYVDKMAFEHIIAHSMGVGLARKAIKGGSAHDHSAGNYTIGNSIRDRINTFIGIAGMNLGLGPCLAQP